MLGSLGKGRAGAARGRAGPGRKPKCQNSWLVLPRYLVSEHQTDICRYLLPAADNRYLVRPRAGLGTCFVQELEIFRQQGLKIIPEESFLK